eukprot:214305_1
MSHRSLLRNQRYHTNYNKYNNNCNTSKLRMHSSVLELQYRTVIEKHRFCIDPDALHMFKLAYSLIIRIIIYAGCYTIWTNFDIHSNIAYIIPVIMAMPITAIFIIFLIYMLMTCSYERHYGMRHAIFSVSWYLLFSFFTGLQQQPYLEYRGNKLYKTLYKWVHKFGLSQMERMSRGVVLRYYLMVNYLASYKSIVETNMRTNNYLYIQRHKNKMLDYRQKCFDDFYELNQFNEYYVSKFPQHINIFHDCVLDIRQFDNTHWKSSHYIMNTIFGVLFYLWKVMVFILENCLAFFMFYPFKFSVGWIIWMVLVVIRDVNDLMAFYHFIRFNITFKTYYFDNKILAAILKWKDKTYHKVSYKNDIIYEELNNYYWDYITRIACKTIIVQWINEIHIAIIIQSYMGAPQITLSEGDSEDLRRYYRKVDW